MVHGRKFISVLTLTVLVLGPGAWAGTETGMKGALADIPADVMGFVCVPSAKALDEKVNKLMQQLGLAQFMPTSLLTLVKEQTGVGDALDEAGSLALIVYEPASPSPDELHNAAVILLPTANAAQLLESLKAGEETDGVRPLSFFGRDQFAFSKGGHVYIGASKATLKKVAASEKDITSRLDPASLGHLQTLDLAVWVDAQKLVKLVKPFIDQLQEMAKAQAQGSGAGSFTAIQLRSMTRSINMLTEGLESAQIGVSLTPKGLGVSFLMATRAGTKMCELVEASPSTDKSLMVGLPADKFIVAGGQIMQAEATKESITDLDALFEAEELKQHCDVQQLGTIRDSIREMLLALRGASFSISALPESPEGLVGLTVVSKVVDGQKWMDNLAKVVAACKKVTQKEEVAKALELVKHEAGAATVEGTKVDRLSFDLAAFTEMEEKEVEEMKKVLGSDGVSVRLAAASPEHVVITFGGGEARMAEVLKLVKAGGSPLGEDAGIKKVSSSLPGKRYSEVYFAGDRLVALLSSIGKVTGNELPIRMAEVNAPVALVSSSQGPCCQVDVFVPMEMVVAIKDTVMQLMGAMMGGAKQTQDDTL